MLRDQLVDKQDNKIKETKMYERPDEIIVVTSSREHESILRRWSAPCKRPDLSNQLDDEMTTWDLETWVPEDMRISDDEMDIWITRMIPMSEEERVYVLEYLAWMSIVERRENVSYTRAELEKMGLWGEMILYSHDYEQPLEKMTCEELQTALALLSKPREERAR